MSIDAVTRYGLDMSGKTDNASKLADMAVELGALAAAQAPMPRVEFAEGVLAFSKFPNLAFKSLQLVALGEVRLTHVGIGDAIVLGPDNLNNGVSHMVLDGFTLYCGPQTTNGVVLRAIHDAYVTRLRVEGVNKKPVPGNGLCAGVQVLFCMSTQFDMPIASGGGIGMVFDYDARYPNLPSACCRVNNCNFGSNVYGFVMKCGNFNAVYDGTMEGNGTAIYFPSVPGNVNPAGHNHIVRVELELNQIDVDIDSPAHHNRLELFGTPKVKMAGLATLTNRVVDAEPLL